MHALQGALPLMHASKAKQTQLHRHAVSNTLAWVLACLMMHRDSKMIISKVCLDTVSPFISNAEVPRQPPSPPMRAHPSACSPTHAMLAAGLPVLHALNARPSCMCAMHAVHHGHA
jgi:hypothetical protein